MGFFKKKAWKDAKRWGEMDGDSQKSVVREIRDQEELYSILKMDETKWQAELEIIERISDITIIEKMALDKNLSDSWRATSIKKISNPTIISLIAESDDESEYTKIPAFEKLWFPGNEKLFFNIAANTQYSYLLRVPIIEKITDEEMLFDIALNEYNDAAIVNACLSKINDKNKIIEVATKAKWFAARRLAVRNYIDDEEILKSIAKNDMDKDVKKAALEKLDSEDSKKELSALSMVSEADVENVCAKIQSDEPMDRFAAAENILEMRNNKVFTQKSRTQIISAFLQAMKRSVPNEFNYSYAANYQLNFNGNIFIGQLLSRFYNDADTLSDDKAKIETINGIIAGYNDYEGGRNPVYYDCENGFRL